MDAVNVVQGGLDSAGMTRVFTLEDEIDTIHEGRRPVSGYEHDDVRDDSLYVDDVYDDEVWAEHRDHMELEPADRLLRHGEGSIEPYRRTSVGNVWPVNREAA